MYPYVLGIHFKSQMLCRLPHPLICNFIPQGFGRVLRHRKYARFKEQTIVYSGPKLFPYTTSFCISDWVDVELKLEYTSLFRWIDLQRRYNEPVNWTKYDNVVSIKCKRTIG